MAKKREAETPSADFETLLAETEQLVEQLERGDLPLDASLKNYEKGVANLRACSQLLQTAEEKVKKLVEAANGELQLVDFAEADSDEETE